ncbi:MAG: squalene synthase HpnC [Actinomycetota bacterium]|nr:squalene synthase HpnC [Actinomycetota bacterium]
MAPIGSYDPVEGRLTASSDVVARARQENFPVASHLLPARLRTRLMAIYGFARLADDIGDEVDGDRLADLDWLQAELESAYEGHATHPAMRRLSPVLAELKLNREPFLALIEANRVDQKVRRYETFDDLVGYCMLSAAPVGRLVLDVFRVSTPSLVPLSDDVCIGLQIVEHLQDVGEDARRGRIYLPQEDMGRFGCRGDDLLASSASPALRRLVAFEAERAANLLASGVALARQLPMRPRVAVAGFAAGGTAALAAIRRADHDVLSANRAPRPLTVARHAISNMVMSSRIRAAA